jgi:hypothetical protein
MRNRSFSEHELDEALQTLYGQGRFADGEELCFDILRTVRPGWETANLFLLLNLAAQDAEVEALNMLDRLSDQALEAGRKLLDFGSESEVEAVVCEQIQLILSNPHDTRPSKAKPSPSPSIGQSRALRRVARRIREVRPPTASKKSDL